MPVSKAISQRKDNFNGPHLRVTRLANARLDKIVKALQKKGLVVSKTSFVSELLLAQPIPGNHQVPAAEVKAINQEAIS